MIILSSVHSDIKFRKVIRIEMKLEEFKKIHPYPDEAGEKSLFKYMSISLDHIERIEKLFLECKIFHNLTEGFNDPFEGKPHYSIDIVKRDAKIIYDHFIELARNHGQGELEAERFAKFQIQDPHQVTETIRNAINKSFEQIRICCYSTNKENLLLWAHYANSHKGFCVEFDGSSLPAKMAMKVEYSNKYPSVEYPVPSDERAYRLALTKAKVWEYENEYRSIFIPSSDILDHDGESLSFSSDAITNVYIGACMPEKEERELKKIIYRMESQPSMWKAELSSSSYQLKFKKIQ